MKKLLFCLTILLFAACKKEKVAPVPPATTTPPATNQVTYSDYKVCLTYSKGTSGINDVQMYAYVYTYDTLTSGPGYIELYQQSWYSTALSGHYEEKNFQICDTVKDAYIDASVNCSTGYDNCTITVYKDGLLFYNNNSPINANTGMLYVNH